MKLLEHKHIIIRAEVLDPPRAEEPTSELVKTLINDIGMKIMMGPFAARSYVEGTQGLTVATIIETSHIVLHTWVFLWKKSKVANFWKVLKRDQSFKFDELF